MYELNCKVYINGETDHMHWTEFIMCVWDGVTNGIMSRTVNRLNYTPFLDKLIFVTHFSVIVSKFNIQK